MKLILLLAFPISLLFAPALFAQQPITNDADVDQLILQLAQQPKPANDKENNAYIPSVNIPPNKSIGQPSINAKKEFSDDNVETHIYEEPEVEDFDDPIAEEWHHPGDE